MKTILAFLFLSISFGISAQELNDRIYLINGDSIICKITKFDGSWVYYDYSKKGNIKNTYVHLDDVKFYTQNGVKRIPYEYEIKQYTEVVKIDSLLKKDQLYSLFMEWVAKNYVSANNVIQYQDKIEGKIIVKGVFKVYLNAPITNINEEAGYVSHTLSIQVKDGRFKYVIEDLFYDGNARYPGKANVNDVKAPGTLSKNQWLKIKEQVNSEIENSIKSLKGAVSNKNNGEW